MMSGLTKIWISKADYFFLPILGGLGVPLAFSVTFQGSLIYPTESLGCLHVMAWMSTSGKRLASLRQTPATESPSQKHCSALLGKPTWIAFFMNLLLSGDYMPLQGPARSMFSNSLLLAGRPFSIWSHMTEVLRKTNLWGPRQVPRISYHLKLLPFPELPPVRLEQRRDLGISLDCARALGKAKDA